MCANCVFKSMTRSHRVPCSFISWYQSSQLLQSEQGMVKGRLVKPGFYLFIEVVCTLKNKDMHFNYCVLFLFHLYIIFISFNFEIN